MLGQGSPSLLVVALARVLFWAARARRLGLALCLLGHSAAAVADGLFDEPIRIRLAWGGTDAALWLGHVALDSGSLFELRAISSVSEGAASVRLEDGRLHVASHRPQRFQCVEVSVDAPADAKLIFQLTTSPASQPVRYAVPLADLLERDFQERIDDRGSRILALRPADDAVRIVPHQQPLIFAPGEPFTFDLRLLLPNLAPGTALDVRTTLAPARGKRTTLWSEQQRLPVPVGGVPAATLSVPLPKQEGVYDVRLTATHPTGFRERFLPGTANPPLTERRLQVVVLESVRPAAAADGRWETVLEIDPASPRWWDRLPAWTQLRRIPGLNRGPLGSIRVGAVSHPLGRFVELPAAVPENDPHWQAYPLPIEAIDAPHRLEITYPADEEAHFGVSIIEPGDEVGPFSRDSGVYIEGFGQSERNEKQVHRLVFWPRTEAPLLLVTNRHPTAPARFGAIRLSRWTTPRLNTDLDTPPQPPDRLVAAYLARPVMMEPAAAHADLIHSPSTISTMQLPRQDSRTLYKTATRLADYLPYAGYNGAVVSVLADGQALYPSLLLDPVADPLGASADDSDRFHYAGSTDGLELLLRVFDRDRLAMLPALRFTGPLAELEQLRHGSDPQISGLELIGPDGLPPSYANGTAGGEAPHYNVLDPRVQQAMFNVVRELMHRYRHHPALAGVAVQLTADSYARLPGLEWGLDDATIARFERDTDVQLAAAGPDRFAARNLLLTGEYADTWQEWRATNLARFYRQLAALVRYDDVQRQLLLLTDQSFADPRHYTRIRPTLLDKRSHLDRILIQCGIDRQQLASVPGISVCPTRYVEPATPLVDRAVGIELTAQFAAWHRTPADGKATSAMLYHPGHPLRLASFDAKSPFHTDTLLRTQPIAGGAAARQPLLAVLVGEEPAVLLRGGERIPVGGEELTRDLMRILQKLPIAAEVQVHREQPVTVRSYLLSQRTTKLLFNESPWTAEVEVVLDVPDGATVQPLVADASSQIRSNAPKQLSRGRQTWSVQLGPYGVEAVDFDTGGVHVVDVRSSVSAAARSEIERAIEDLDRRDLNAPSVYKVLTNPGFEPIGGSMPGWRLTDGAEHATAELDATLPRSGKTSLYVHSARGSATIESDPFPTPPTGQLFFTAWIRGEKLQPDTEVRMVLETAGSEPAYRRYAAVGGDAPGSQPLDHQWRYYGFSVHDLPLDSHGRMRIKFELSGPGDVWIDDVQLHDVLFPLGSSWYATSEQEKLELIKLMRAVQSAFHGDRLTDCLQLLESYWARFLLAYTPPVRPVVSAQPSDAGAPPDADAPASSVEQPPAVSGWRRYIPLLR